MAPTRELGSQTAERAVTLAGIETRELVLEGSGPPFLLIHGYADSADTWRPLLAELGDAGRAATAIDLAGFGASDVEGLGAGPLLPRWDAMVAEAVSRLSAAHDGSDVFIAGNSLGGALAMRAAQDPGLPLAGIVPIAPAGLHMARWFPIIESERMLRLLRRSPFPVPEVLVREIVGRVYVNLAFADRSRATPELVASFTRHLPTVARSTAILDLGRRLLAELESPFDLDAIECPLLLVWGDRDRMVFTTGAERVLRTVPYSDIEVLPGCGHCPQVEAPQELADLLLRFPEDFEHRTAEEE